MTSNAYIASDGEKLMKVGKSNNPKRREKQIDLTITLTIDCLDEVSAYKIESQLRQFIAERGGIKHASTVEWFIFDPQSKKKNINQCKQLATGKGYLKDFTIQ